MKDNNNNTCISVVHLQWCYGLGARSPALGEAKTSKKCSALAKRRIRVVFVCVLVLGGGVSTPT